MNQSNTLFALDYLVYHANNTEIILYGISFLISMYAIFQWVETAWEVEGMISILDATLALIMVCGALTVFFNSLIALAYLLYLFCRSAGSFFSWLVETPVIKKKQTYSEGEEK